MEGSSRGMSRSVKIGQRHPYLMALSIHGTGPVSVVEGGKDVSLVKNATGDYTLSFKQAFMRLPVVTVSPLTANCYAQVFAVGLSSVQIKTYAVSNQAALDADFHLHVLGFDAADAV